MKKNGMMFVFLGITSSMLLLSTPAISGKANVIQNEEHKQSKFSSEKEINVSDAQGLKDALTSPNQGGTPSKTIYLTQDIDLSKVKAEDLDFDVPFWSGIQIDGQGFSITNKPSDLKLMPLIYKYDMSASEDDKASIKENFLIRNLTLDNVGSFIGEVEMDAMFNIAPLSSNDLHNIGISFQNITIKNNKIENQRIQSKGNLKEIPNAETLDSQLSLLLNTAFVYHAGIATSDETFSFYNIHIENNIIQNNTIQIDEEVANASFSFLTNIVFQTCSNVNHSHESFLNFEYIFINDNTFKDNVYTVDNYSTKAHFINESSGNLIGSIKGLGSWTGSNGNHIYISNIFITNNIIGSSKNVTKDQFDYSELISTSGNNSNQWLSFESFNNIFSINNKAYTFDNNGKEVELTYKDEITVINLNLQSGNNSWDEYNSSSLYFYGDMFEENTYLNLFIDDSGNIFNDIHHDIYLSTDSQDYQDLIVTLNNSYGLYNYQISTDIIKNENDEEITIVTGLNSNLEDWIDILSANFIYDGNKVIAIEMNFNFYQKTDLNNLVLEPYVFTNLQLSDGNGQVWGTSNESSSTNANKNYVYTSTFWLEDPFELTKKWMNSHSLDNIYMDFNIDSTYNKAAGDFDKSIKLDQQQLQDILSEKATGTSRGLIIASAITGIIVFLILLILLILLLKYLSDRKKLAAVGEVQDGYYEFSDYNEANPYPNNQDDYYEDTNNHVYDQSSSTEVAYDDYDNNNYDDNYEYSETENYDNYKYSETENYDNYEYSDTNNYDYESNFDEYTSDEEDIY